jgi:hypothetical protein
MPGGLPSCCITLRSRAALAVAYHGIGRGRISSRPGTICVRPTEEWQASAATCTSPVPSGNHLVRLVERDAVGMTSLVHGGNRSLGPDDRTGSL